MGKEKRIEQYICDICEKPLPTGTTIHILHLSPKLFGICTRCKGKIIDFIQTLMLSV